MRRMFHDVSAVEADIYEMEKVTYVRMAKREGLIRARMLGAEVARGEVKCTLLMSDIYWLLGLVDALLNQMSENIHIHIHSGACVSGQPLRSQHSMAGGDLLDH